ncbi:uncharacterized protein BDV17DRAFT_199006 [Aspergillus undulatus]|uniref:uncharacterized protein n=1 Tax=Aspergillus undulatus TaxID=1810928 RepID=UPI003CCD0804
MKRTYAGVPAGMTHSWGQPPQACQTCRQKKRRCDRQWPCSNCSQRRLPCEYADPGRVHGRVERISAPAPEAFRGAIDYDDGVSDFMALAELPGSGDRHAREEILSSTGTGEVDMDMSKRVRRLEEAVFQRSGGSPGMVGNGPGALTVSQENERLRAPHFVPFARVSENMGRWTSPAEAHKLLPPLSEAKTLFDHFATTMHQTIGILHIPSAYDLMEQVYQGLAGGTAPEKSTTMLLFAIFAVSAASPPDALMELPEASPYRAIAAYGTYLRTARSIMENGEEVPASTTALAALTLLAHLVTNDSAHGLDGHLLRSRCYWMARTMDIHRLDTPKRRKERKEKGFDVIELEVQRRIWWNLIATDWLSAFSGGVQEGSYLYHPNHMCVDLPSNLDDADIMATKCCDPKPLSEPTSTTFLIYRAKLATICREAVDSMPPMSQGIGPCYDTILALDARFQDCLAELPSIYQLDQETLVGAERARFGQSHVVWQRITAHLAVHTRLCRLHRPYHLKGMTDPKYKYSRDVCVRSAQTVLDLRRSMDEKKTDVGLKPDRFWVVAQHVFLAALTLATDVSFDGSAPDAEERKNKVRTAYNILERSTGQSYEFRETIRQNLRTLMATLNREGQATADPTSDRPSGMLSTWANSDQTGSATTPEPNNLDEHEDPGDVAPFNRTWDELWSEFLTVAPDLDLSQWDQLLDGADAYVV